MQDKTTLKVCQLFLRLVEEVTYCVGKGIVVERAVTGLWTKIEMQMEKEKSVLTGELRKSKKL